MTIMILTVVAWAIAVFALLRVGQRTYREQGQLPRRLWWLRALVGHPRLGRFLDTRDR